MARAPIEPLVYSVPEAATAAGVSPGTMRAMIEAGEMPHVKVGSRTVIRRATLVQWLQDNERVENRKRRVRRYTEKVPPRRLEPPGGVVNS